MSAADRYRVEDATMDDALAVASRLRLADRHEVWAWGMMTPETAVLTCMRTADMAKVGLADGVPVCVFGVGPASILSGIGSPWLLGTDDVDRHAVAFLRGSRVWLDQMLERYSRLANWVDCRNEVSIRWLSWLGFHMLEPEPFGPFALPFRRFTMEV